MFVLFIFSGINLFSNDGRIFYGDSVQYINDENTNVIMEEEEITISLFKDYYDIDVLFKFYNSGYDEYIMVGFPIEISAYSSDIAFFNEIHKFETYINGEPIDYIIKEVKDDRDDSVMHTGIRWYIREVLFPVKEYTYSRVIYRVPYSYGPRITDVGYNTNYLWHELGYIFWSGKNWKNNIGKMIVNINFNNDILISNYFIGRDKSKELLKKFSCTSDGKYRFEFENINPQVDDKIIINKTSFVPVNGEMEFFTKNHDYIWGWDSILLEKSIYPHIYTKDQTRLFINYFYAIHGYNFKSEKYRQYFNGMKFYLGYWNEERFKIYQINGNFSENDFNEIEKMNINYLLNLEKMIP